MIQEVKDTKEFGFTDEIMEQFREIAEEATNLEEVEVGQYRIPKDLLDDWNTIVGMDIFDYIKIHAPKDSDALEIQMTQTISAALQ